jgi:pilus assembly protein CpaE
MTNTAQAARILVVDDDDTTARLIEVLLSEAGYRVTVAPSGELAFEDAERHPPDLAILDVMLPGMDGYTLCRMLRQSPPTRSLPILMLTAQGDTEDKLAGFDAGADVYLTKPFAPAELVYRIRGLLGRGQIAPPRAPQPKSRAPGQRIAVFGAKGGVGKTTIAVNLAIALAAGASSSVVLVDGDLTFGDVSVHLNLTPTRTILDLLERVEDLDREVFNQALIRHDSDVRVLLSPFRPEQAERVTPEHIQAILDSLACYYDYVVVDCPASYDDVTLAILENADRVLIVVTPEIGPVKNTGVFLDLAAEIGIAEDKLMLVLNRANSEVGISAGEIENTLRVALPFHLNSGGRPVVLSVNRGRPLLLEHPQHPFSLGIKKIAQAVRVPVAAKT